jgi:hypothetical protein
VSGGCTNWAAYDVPAIWTMVSGEDSHAGWAAPPAWAALAQSTDDQRKRLLAARAALEDAWPPSENEAAKPFFAEIDRLVASMEETARRAGETAGAVGWIMESLADAKKAIEPLQRQYESKNHDLIPNWVDGAEDDLNRQARIVMARANAQIGDHAAMITVPTPYYLPGSGADASTHDPGRNQSAISTTGASGANHLAGSRTNIPHTPPEPMPGHSGILPPNSPGVGLAGGPAPSAPSPVIGVPSPPADAPPRSPIIPPIGGPIEVPVRPVSYAGAKAGRSGGIPDEFSGRSALPAGAVLRGPEGFLEGRSGAAGSQFREVDLPFGQAMGEERPAGGAPSGDAVRNGLLPAGAAAGGPRGGGRAGRQGRADTEWDYAGGVPAIIEPDRRSYGHDPGPGVIGIDR